MQVLQSANGWVEPPSDVAVRAPHGGGDGGSATAVAARVWAADLTATSIFTQGALNNFEIEVPFDWMRWVLLRFLNPRNQIILGLSVPLGTSSHVGSCFAFHVAASIF